MTIHLATDHAGFLHKEAVKQFLLGRGVTVVDHGATAIDATDDYPDFVIPAAQAVANDTESRGIIFGGSGQGEAMAANRISGVRAAVYYGGAIDIVTHSRAHNDANILSLGARFLSIDEAVEAVTIWSEIPFSNDERDIRRINKF